MPRALKPSPLALAQTMAKAHRLVIRTVRTGDATRWMVYRQMDHGRVFVGERTTEESLLRLVKSACGSTAVVA